MAAEARESGSTGEGRLSVRLGCGAALLWVAGMIAVGVLSFLVASILPLDDYVLPPASLALFGVGAGLVRAWLLPGQGKGGRVWVRASSLAGLVGGLICIFPTGLAATSAGLYAGWAYAWAAYGASLGVFHERMVRVERMILADLAAWSAAGILAGMAGWHGDVMRISGTAELRFHIASSMTRTWPVESIASAGAILGATGGLISAGILVLRSAARPEDPSLAHRPQSEEDNRLIKVAGLVSGVMAAVLCAFIGPLIVTKLIRGSLASLELVTFFLNLAAGSVLCVPTYAVVCVPSAWACARVGLRRARKAADSDVRPRVWLWSMAGGVLGYMLCSLVAYAIGAMD